MTEGAKNVDRRRFLKTGTLGTAGLLVGFTLPWGLEGVAAAPAAVMGLTASGG